MQMHWILAAGIIGLSLVGVLALAQTRWLQSDTLKKCVVLSVGVHLVLALVAAGIGGMRPLSRGLLDEGRMTMVMVVSESLEETGLEPAAAGLAEAVNESPLDEPMPDDGRNEVLAEDIVSLLDLADADGNATASVDSVAAEIAPRVPFDDLAVPELLAEPSGIEDRSVSEPPLTVEDAVTGPGTGAADASLPPGLTSEVYADRFGRNRQAAAAARGGSLATEQAVQAGLAWLAGAQSADGRWDADMHGAGIERVVDGRDRRGGGSRSDHGVTGLALLAMLGAGNTHQLGEHAETVDRGLRFLVDRQSADGSLAGDAEFFAALYCHGMATIAIAEAVALTGDDSLRGPLAKALGHTLAMQSPATGGWRYAAGDRGDTSQLGWQVMALSSGQLAGVTGLDHAQSRARAFLQSVSSGRFGGLAAYREGERPSIAMTAEALFCRMLLGLDPGHPAAVEALELIAASPPDVSRPNAYTWYYATLASFHGGGPQWERWNPRMQAAVLALQRRDGGSLVGSWDPDPVWGGHGGRVYATALSVMTLEVYYRYRPMHDPQEKRSVAAAAVP